MSIDESFTDILDKESPSLFELRVELCRLDGKLFWCWDEPYVLDEYPVWLWDTVVDSPDWLPSLWYELELDWLTLAEYAPGACESLW